jgi:hypothetical protein
VSLFLCALILKPSINLAQSGQKWSAGGNSISSGDFLGTTNNLPFILKVNNAQAFLEIFDLYGKKIKTLFINKEIEAGDYTIPYDLSELGEGMYLYSLTVGSDKVVKKLIKQSH